MVLEMITHASLVALLGLLVPLATVAVAIGYAVRPAEGWLAVMRPLSLAAMFAGLCSFAAGVATTLSSIGMTDPSAAVEWRSAALGIAETFIALFVTFGCLTIAWVLVAVGLRRA